MNGNAADSWSEQVKGEAAPIIRLWSPSEKGDAHAIATAKTLLAHIDAISEILKRYHFTEVDIMPALPHDFYDPRESDCEFEIFTTLPKIDNVFIHPHHVTHYLDCATGLMGSINRPFPDVELKELHIRNNNLEVIYNTNRRQGVSKVS